MCSKTVDLSISTGTVQYTLSRTQHPQPSLLIVHKKHAPRPYSTHPTTHRLPALEVPAHVVPDPGVVEEALDASHRADGDILVPQPPLGKVHHVLLRHAVDDALDLGRLHPPSGGDDLAADVLGNGGGAVEGEEDRSLELGLCPLNLGLGDVGAEARPFAEGEVDEVVDLRKLVGDEVDTPETVSH